MVAIEQVSPEAFPPEDNLFQTAFWGTFKKCAGQKPYFFSVTFTDDASSSVYTFPFLALLRSRHDGSCYAYAPKAPSIALPAERRGTLLEELALALRPHVPENCICLRCDLAWRSQYGGEEIVKPETAQLALNWGTKTHKLRKAPGNHLAPDTVIINLSLMPERIFIFPAFLKLSFTLKLYGFPLISFVFSPVHSAVVVLPSTTFTAASAVGTCSSVPPSKRCHGVAGLRSSP